MCVVLLAEWPCLRDLSQALGVQANQCWQCFKIFSSSVHLRKHMETHILNPVLTPSVKGKHKGVPSGGQCKPFKCDVCGKGFTQKSHQRNHERIHSGEKPYKCSICLKAFTQSAHLKRHLQQHSGKKPFMCSVCLKCFSRNDNLTTHMASVHRHIP